MPRQHWAEESKLITEGAEENHEDFEDAVEGNMLSEFQDANDDDQAILNYSMRSFQTVANADDASEYLFRSAIGGPGGDFTHIEDRNQHDEDPDKQEYDTSDLTNYDTENFKSRASKDAHLLTIWNIIDDAQYEEMKKLKSQLSSEMFVVKVL